MDGPKPGGGKPETLQMELPLSSLAGAWVWLVPGATIQESSACCQGAVLGPPVPAGLFKCRKCGDDII